MGSMIVLYIRKYMWAFLLHICIGWLIGSILTSILIFLTSAMLAINIGHIIVIMIIQCVVSFALFILLKNDHIPRPNNKLINIRFEVSPSIYFVIFIIGSITLWYNHQVFSDFPETAPVVEFDKAESLAVPERSDPAAYSDFFAAEILRRAVNFLECDPSHVHNSEKGRFSPFYFSLL